MQILQPPGWPAPKGYANGIAAEGRTVYVAGQVGWDENCQFPSDDFADQVELALRNIVAVLAEAGAEPRHIVRMTWYLADREAYLSSLKRVGEAYRRVIGRHYPAMTAVEVSALVSSRAKVEIEVTAVIPRD